MPNAVSITKHYGYLEQRFAGKDYNRIAYVVYSGLTIDGVFVPKKPVDVVRTESEAVGACKRLELENF